MADKYRKRPVDVEAMQFDGSIESASRIAQWANADVANDLGEDPIFSYTTLGGSDNEAYDAIVVTDHGSVEVNDGDWVIKGVAGEFYPCKAKIFDATYDKV